MSDSVPVNDITPPEDLTPLDLRRIEVAQYDANIAMYKSILETLPSEWPDHLVEYRNPSNEHDTSSQIDDLDDLALVSQLWYADNVYKMIRSETVERTKAAAILAAMEAV
jgi:hypothetical protein